MCYLPFARKRQETDNVNTLVLDFCISFIFDLNLKRFLLRIIKREGN